jgi:hypothetical protein
MGRSEFPIGNHACAKGDALKDRSAKVPAGEAYLV